MNNIFRAGNYYVGDPCYVIEKWDELIKSTGCFGLEEDKDTTNWHNGCFSYNGKKCFAEGTAYGDGTYFDNKGREYGVDAGLIGIVPVSAIDKNKRGDGGQIVEFKEDFRAFENKGIFTFGNLVINTRDDDDEDRHDDEDD